jgi:1-acyl-sn-glycerol-3-phosphate acyltransferase
MLRPLDRAWRLFATGTSFVLFGIGSLALGLIVFPPLHLLAGSRATARRWSRWLVHQSFRAFIGFNYRAGVLTFEAAGDSSLMDGKPRFIIANHPSLIDVVCLISRLPDAFCIVKTAAWENPFMGLVVRATGYIPNDDPTQLIENCVRLLRQGETLVMFPEGTRTVPGNPLRFRRGAANIALRAGMVLTPVFIDVEPETLTKGEAWYAIPDRRVHVRMEVGEDIDPSDVVSDPTTERLAARELNSFLVTHFEAHCRGKSDEYNERAIARH